MIAFKDNRADVLMRIAEDARWAAQAASSCMTGKPLNEALAQIIGQAVAAGIERMIEESYKQEDFEKDIGLKP